MRAPTRSPRSTGSGKKRVPAARNVRPSRFVWINLLLAALLGGWFLLQPAERRAEVTHLVRNYVERDKQVRLPELAWDLYQLYYGSGYVPAIDGDKGDHLFGGQPIPASGSSLRILRNTGYTVGYSDALGSPVWAAYRIGDLDTRRAAPRRPDRFEIDRRTVARVAPEDYSGSGYDRGHLAPNYAIATRFGETAQRETFLMSNVVPQRHSLNAGAWRELEQRIAVNYPARFREVWVLAGPIFNSPVRRLRSAAIPDAFYMIIADESDGRLRVQAFVFPQDTAPTADLASALTSIDAIEARTGLDFFPALEDAAEAALEANRAMRVW